MKSRIGLPVLILVLASLGSAQQASQPAPPMKGLMKPGMGPMAEQHKKMMEMHKQHLAAMQADVDKMKAALEQMKANVAKVSDAGEKARWQTNVDLWTVMVGHMEQMVKEMGSMGPGMGMGPGMMHHRGMGGPPTPPPTEAKPQ